MTINPREHLPQKHEVILLQEGWLESLLKDTTTFGGLIAVVALGLILNSQALQWLGGLCWLIWITMRGVTMTMRTMPRRTPQEAADHLWRTYGVRARDNGPC